MRTANRLSINHPPFRPHFSPLSSERQAGTMLLEVLSNPSQTRLPGTLERNVNGQ